MPTTDSPSTRFRNALAQLEMDEAPPMYPEFEYDAGNRFEIAVDAILELGNPGMRGWLMAHVYGYPVATPDQEAHAIEIFGQSSVAPFYCYGPS